MFFYRGKPLTSRASSETSFSSDNSFLSNRNATSAGILRQLSVNELDEINSTGFNQEYPVQRELFDTSRPLFTIPRPTIYLPMNNSERSRRFSRTSTPSTITHSSERAFYQNLPPPPPPLPSLPSLSTQYPIDSQLLFPPRAQRYVPLPMNYPIKKRKKSAREKPPALSQH
ncbi:unnamed protein product [Adineta ricciae]|uniref:Uncharacterized protein n=1 Tax=Adineta ricciae TaxID=249248 RepID=A0A813RY77_ADIRI|nr:unnamed protein product [Adineta ricciae]